MMKIFLYQYMCSYAMGVTSPLYSEEFDEKMILLYEIHVPELKVNLKYVDSAIQMGNYVECIPEDIEERLPVDKQPDLNYMQQREYNDSQALDRPRLEETYEPQLCESHSVS